MIVVSIKQDFIFEIKAGLVGLEGRIANNHPKSEEIKIMVADIYACAAFIESNFSMNLYDKINDAHKASGNTRLYVTVKSVMEGPK